MQRRGWWGEPSDRKVDKPNAKKEERPNEEWSGGGRRGGNEGGKRDGKGKNAMERDRARESKHV